MTTERVRRLFFALWPDDPVRGRIETATLLHLRAAAGRPMSVRNLHVTVAFLGAVTESRLGCVQDAGGAVCGTPFDLVLSSVEYWRRQRLLCVQPVETPPALAALAAEVWRALAACAFEPETRPFRTHMTLVRDARAPRGVANEIEPIVWRVRELTLVESITDPRGARYEPLQTWTLAHVNPGAAAS